MPRSGAGLATIWVTGLTIAIEASVFAGLFVAGIALQALVLFTEFEAGHAMGKVGEGNHRGRSIAGVPGMAIAAEHRGNLMDVGTIRPLFARPRHVEMTQETATVGRFFESGMADLAVGLEAAMPRGTLGRTKLRRHETNQKQAGDDGQGCTPQYPSGPLAERRWRRRRL